MKSQNLNSHQTIGVCIIIAAIIIAVGLHDLRTGVIETIRETEQNAPDPRPVFRMVVDPPAFAIMNETDGVFWILNPNTNDWQQINGPWTKSYQMQDFVKFLDQLKADPPPSNPQNPDND